MKAERHFSLHQISRSRVTIGIDMAGRSCLFVLSERVDVPLITRSDDGYSVANSLREMKAERRKKVESKSWSLVTINSRDVRLILLRSKRATYGSAAMTGARHEVV